MKRPLSPQVRGARAMLGWSIMALARAAQVSVSMIKRVEDGGAQLVSDNTQAAIAAALEDAGVMFLPDDGDGPGIRLKSIDEPAAPFSRLM